MNFQNGVSTEHKIAEKLNFIESYLVIELIGPAECLVVEEAAGAPVPERALFLLLVGVEHVEEGEEVALGNLEVPLGHPRLVALARRLQVHVFDLHMMIF